MRQLLPFVFAFICLGNSSAQDYRELACGLYEQYELFREKAIVDRRFKHADIVPLMQRLRGKPGIESVEVAGRSVEGREIYLIRIGTGPIPVLLWSQMHGDEPTATMALMDLFRFFTNSDDGFDPLRRNLRSQLSLYFLPMLNPDGAEQHQRRNALGIDLNRDALRLQCPESQVLKQTRDAVQAEWGFNLHDQSSYYAAGNTARPASFSFLAPAYNEQKSVNAVRQRSMQLTVELADILDAFLDRQVAKYDDSFEPRAFGDNMQLWGTSTVLIEVGGLQGDLEKQELRRLHFAMLLAAFQCIADGGYVEKPLRNYYAIPDNSRILHELILREVVLSQSGQKFTVDLGFNRDEVSYRNWRNFYSVSRIIDIGDLSTFYAYEELPVQGMQIVPGKLYPQLVSDFQAFRKLSWKQLHLEGYTDIRFTNPPNFEEREALPFRVHKAGVKNVDNQIRFGSNPSFLLQHGGQFRYVVVNGKAYEL